MLLYTHQKIVDVAADWKVWERRYKSDDKGERTVTKTLSKTFKGIMLEEQPKSDRKKDMFKVSFVYLLKYYRLCFEQQVFYHYMKK